MTPRPERLSPATLSRATNYAAVYVWVVFLGVPTVLYLFDGGPIHHHAVWLALLGMMAGILTVLAYMAAKVSSNDLDRRIVCDALWRHAREGGDTDGAVGGAR